ncbi:MAG: hypothetical protein JNG89_04460 [Planctomycetaceae bacterium]|nr:hypothetical protein [Planctomycetaceae bacterium]
MSDPVQKSPRFRISIAESMIVAAIIAFLLLLLVPAIEAARDKAGEPPHSPSPLLEAARGCLLISGPVVAPAFVGLLLVWIRRRLPESTKHRIVWRHPPRPPLTEREFIRTPGPEVAPYTAAASASLAGLGTLLLLTVWAHLHVNRKTNRDPIITWEGPFADYVLLLASCGWLLSAAAMILCIYANLVYRSRWDLLAWSGCMLGGFNLFGSCFLWIAGGED